MRDYFDQSKYPDITDAIMRKGQPRAWKNSRGHLINGLNACQIALYHAMREQKGVVGAIAVGGGKAAGAMICGKAVDADLVVMLAPPTTLHQVRQTWADWRRPFAFDYQFQALSNAWISQAKNTRALSQVFGRAKRPVLVLDEAHMFSNKDSARTKRVQRLLEHRPDIMVVILSGTLMTRSVKDMAHLCDWALKDNSPVPRPETTLLEQWANVIDVDGRPGALDYMACEHLVAWSTKQTLHNTEGTDSKRRVIRESFAHRFHSAAGVVATTKSALGTSLEIYEASSINHKVPPPVLPPEVEECLRQIDTFGEIRIGDQFDILPDTASRHRAKKLLSMGFYMRWEWPRSSNGTPMVDHDWMDARADWLRCVRTELKERSAEGYDSEKLVRDVIAHEALDPSTRKSEIHVAYVKWAAQSRKRWNGEKHPPSVPVWVSTFYVDWAIEWVKANSGKGHGPILVWYESTALRDALIERGLETLLAGQGTDWNRPRNLGVSLLSHVTGIDMPAWHRNLMLEIPPSGQRWEQCLGRTHREGQRADLVEVYVPLHSETYIKAWKSALRSADTIQAAMRNEQKLCYATLGESLPTIYSDSDNLGLIDDFDLVLD